MLLMMLLLMLMLLLLLLLLSFFAYGAQTTERLRERGTTRLGVTMTSRTLQREVVA